MLKRLFTLWLVLSVLGFGTAWAYDGHSVFSEHDAASDLPTHDSQDDGDSVDCDHCCHIGMHLLGILNDSVAPPQSGGHLFLACSEYHLIATPRLPPLRPPRS